MIKAFPKIFTIGQDYIADIFKDEVEVTEKIDGSQFVFGKINNELYLRSKGAQLYIENPRNMFKEGIDYVVSIQDKIPDNTVFYCEYLQNPKHNILKYNRIPKNHLILFGASDITGTKFINEYSKLKEYSMILDIDVVPLLYHGKIDNIDKIKELCELESILGGVKIEGIVVKNYYRKFLLGGQPIPIMMGKYVSEKFKEVHRDRWGKEFTSKGKWEQFKESFRTEARWLKAIQHLKEKNKLENSPRDIGKIIKEIYNDIKEEEQETIKKFLWEQFGEEILRYSVKGFAEFYKEYLMKKTFEGNNENKKIE